MKSHYLYGRLLRCPYILTLASFFLLFGSCRELVDSKIPYADPIPTLNSLISNGLKIRVHVSISQAYDDRPLPNVSDAVLRLYIDSVYTETLQHTENGWYEGLSIGESGKQYRIEAQVDTFPILTAQTVIPAPVRILKHTLIPNYGADEEGATYSALQLTLELDSTQTQYLQVIVQDIYEKTYLFYRLRDPILLSEGLANGLFSTKGIRKSQYTMDLPLLGRGVSSMNGSAPAWGYNPFHIKIRHLTQDAFLYLKTLHLYEDFNYPEIGTGRIPSVNIHHNITNGYGIWAGVGYYASERIQP